MHMARSHHVSNLILCGSFLLPRILADITVQKIVIDQGPWGSPFKVAFSIENGLVMNFNISTETTDPSTLVTFPGSDGLNVASTEHNVGVTFHNSDNISELLLGDWDVETNLELDEGLEATIRLATHWGFDRSSEALEQQTVLDVTGPVSSSVIGHMNSTQLGRSGYCTGLDPAKRTFQKEELNIHLTYSVGLAPYSNATSESKGNIGAKRSNALILSSQLSVKDGCSRRYPICTPDRTGFELCSNYGS